VKTPDQIAHHPKARLHREIVARLRDAGSIEGAQETWGRFRDNARLWKRIVTYGLGLPERQAQLNKIAFPDSDLAEVDAALHAGNNLNRLYELACGRASIARDSAGRSKLGSKGLKIVKHATSTLPGSPPR
jgi:hypothetical protein